jgi:hypothetical protein
VNVSVGRLIRARLRPWIVSASALALLVAVFPAAPASAAQAAANLDQCTNGGVGPPLSLEPCLNGTLGGTKFANWVNGDSNGQKSHWQEGDFISYRVTLTGLTAGSHFVVFDYQTVHGSKHAIDYIGSYDATETTSPTATLLNRNDNNPCFDVLGTTGCTSPGIAPSPVSTLPVPLATLANCAGSAGTAPSQLAGSFAAFGAGGTTLNSATYLSENIVSGSGQCSTTMQINFTEGAANSPIVIAWGGHIASEADWGPGTSAISINGSPYHMALDALDTGTIGSQDRALSTTAIFFSPTMSTTVIDNATGLAAVSPLAIGSTVHDTATLSGSTSNAGGTVVYSFFTNGTCTAPASSNQTVTVSSAAVPNSSNTSPLTAGSYSYQATYSGNSSNAGTTSACEPFSVGKAPTTVSTTVFDAFTNAAWSGTEQTGASAYDTSSVGGQVDGITPTGTISYTFWSNGTCASTGGDAGSLLALGTHSSTEGPLAVGSYSFKATYSGDGNYSGSTSSCEPFSVVKAPTTVSTVVFDAGTDAAWSGTEQTGASAYDTSAVNGQQDSIAPTGTISYTFWSNGSCANAGTAAGSGLALNTHSTTEGPLAVGSYSFKATYSGDGNYSGSTSDCEPFSVGTAPTSISTIVFDAGTNAAWSGTEQTGASAYDTSSVSGQVDGIAPTGTVSYTFWSNGTCASTGSDAGSLLALGSHSSTEGPLAAGSYSFKATYSGDGNYSGSTSSCEPFSVVKAPTTVSTVVFDAGTNAAWSGTEQTGASAYDTSAVHGQQDSIAPTGTISYTFWSNGTCASTGSDAGSGLALATHSTTEGPLAAGSYSFKATYSGDGNYAGSTSDCEPFSVAKAPTTVSTVVFDAGTSAAWSGTEQTGASAYDTSAVHGQQDSIAPTGTISYTFWSNGTCASTGSDAGSLLALGANSNTEGPLAAGSYSFKATYSGDGNYAGSTSDCEPFSVGKAPTSISTVVFDAGTSAAWSGTEQTGASAYDTSNLSGQVDGIAPTGTVSYTFWSNGTCANAGSDAGSLLALGTHSSTEGPLAVGSYSFEAIYSGDGNYAGSTSDCEPFSVGKAPTTVSTVVFDAGTNAAWSGTEQTGASAYDTSAVHGQQDSLVPSGTVTYSFFTNGSCTNPAASSSVQTVSVTGTVPNSSTQLNLAAGSYSFDAVYSGDGNYSGSTSDCEPFSVAKAPTTVSTIVFDAGTNAAWSGTEQTGASAYDTSAVHGQQDSIAPTGTVSYTFWSNGTCANAGSDAGSLLALGANSNTEGPLAAGSYSFKATYSGDGNYAGSTSDCEPFSVVKAPTTVSTVVFDGGTNAAWSGTEQTGASAYDTSNLSGKQDSIVPSGTVTYSFFTNGSCTNPAASSSVQAVSVTGTVPNSSTQLNLAAGSYAFDAVYSGDGNYSGSTSDCEPFSVGKAPTSISTIVFDGGTNAAWSGTEQTGASAYDTSNLSGKQDSIVPSGTVTYSFFTNGSCTNPAASSSVQTVSVTGTVPNSSTQSSLAAGSYAFDAVYSGDGNYSGSTSDCEPFSVAKAPTSISTIVFDAGTNAAWSGTEQTGASAYDTSSLSGAVGGIAPTGTVSYVFWINGGCSSTGTDAGSGLALGANSNPEGPLAAGSYSFEAIYSGDGNYAGSTSACEPFSVVKAPTSISTVVFNAGTNAPWAGTEQTGASAYDTSSLSGKQDSIVPSGTVTYNFFTNGSCTNPAASSSAQTVTVTGMVPNSSTQSNLAAGSYSFDAVYSGDGNYTGSTSGCEPFSVSGVVSQITPTQTTCAMFKSGTAATLSQITYSVKNGTVSQVAPGVFFYWVAVNVTTTGGQTFTIVQSTSTASNFFLPAAGSFAYDANCNTLKTTVTQSGGTTTVAFSTTAAEGPGTYFIGIKYQTHDSIVGESAPSPSTVVYTFNTTGVSGSTSTVTLIRAH